MIPAVGKSEIRVIHVPRVVTVLLWLAVSAGMAALIYALSGKAYTQGRTSIAEIWADILFFLPWGALAFLALDRESAPRSRTYLATMVVGAAFALALTAWQRNLPTRVTGWMDAMWYAVGCLGGAIAGHTRKRVRIRFE